MDGTTIVLGALAAAGCGAAIWLALGRARLSAEHAGERAGRVNAERERDEARADREKRETEKRAIEDELTDVKVERAGLVTQLAAAQAEKDAEVRRVQGLANVQLESAKNERNAIETKLTEFDAKLTTAFGDLAAKALNSNSGAFLDLAKQALAVKATEADGALQLRQQALTQQSEAILAVLAKTDARLSEMEAARVGAYAGLTEQVRGMMEANHGLKTETARLVQALRKPEVRGRWGEIQLERVLEVSGMKAYCDVATQESNRDSEGRLLRPDATVRLPNDRMLAVDAKTNIDAYVDAIEATTEEARNAALDRFTRHVSDQVQHLSRKNYWAQFDGSPQFVVMFIPGDQFIDAAFQREPLLIERAANANIVIASPSTLIGLLKAVVVGWRERQIQEDAQTLVRLGRELHQRGAVFLDHLDGLGTALGNAVEKFNKAVGSFSQNLTPTLRKFEQSAKSEKELVDLKALTVVPRDVSARRGMRGDGKATNVEPLPTAGEGSPPLLDPSPDRFDA